MVENILVEYIAGNPRELSTRWFRQTQHLKRIHLPLHNLSATCFCQWESTVDNVVHTKETLAWQSSMLSKSTLVTYHHKQSISRESLYDNTKGSNLFFKVRAGSLETNHRVHHWSGLPLGCPLCFAPIKDVEHVAKYCPALGPIPDAWSDMPMADLLGFLANRQPSFSHLDGVRARLMKWWTLHHKD